MNHGHQCAGICTWKQRGNKIIVTAGYQSYQEITDDKYVEEFDMDKNQWYDLPKLNNKHAAYPALFTLDNILFCIGGVDFEDKNLGDIELLDSRDSSNKWIFVDSVENYLDIPKQGGARFICFLSFN